MSSTHTKYAQHLLDAIAAHYPVKANLTGTKYIGIALDWNYERRADKQVRHVQEVCGKFLYPARTVDNTMMMH